MNTVAADCGRIAGKNRPSDDVNVALCTRDIVPGVFLNLCPRAGVLARILRNHVGQRKRLRHGCRVGHIARWGHVASAVSRALVVAQFGTLSPWQARVREEFIGAFFVCVSNACPVQLLCNENRSFGGTAMKDRKAVVANLAQ